jgi:hypothetical protein
MQAPKGHSHLMYAFDISSIQSGDLVLDQMFEPAAHDRSESSSDRRTRRQLKWRSLP